MWPLPLYRQAEKVIDLLCQHRLTVATAESCTGGLITGLLTSIPGASEVVEGGVCTYSNQQKIHILGVEKTILEQHGAVSKEVAMAMAQGARRLTNVSIAISCTGIAGPGGGSKEKPVGLVYIGIATSDKTAAAHRHLFSGNREKVRLQTIEQALMHIMPLIQKPVHAP